MYALYEEETSAESQVFKLDMRKAYDQIEWGYLRVIMSRLFFLGTDHVSTWLSYNVDKDDNASNNSGLFLIFI